MKRNGEVSERGDTANAVETAIDRAKADERLTWAELVNETRLRIRPPYQSPTPDAPARRAEPEGTTTGETKSAGRVPRACAMCLDTGCYDGKWCDCATGQRRREREPRGPT